MTMPLPVPQVTRLRPAPPHLGPAGKALWIATVRDFQVETEPLLVHLSEACSALDRLTQCRQVIEAEGLMVEDGGRRVPHPLLKAEASARSAFQSAMRALRLQPHR
jgi:hypothetical protein